jgi:hypothetical protein
LQQHQRKHRRDTDCQHGDDFVKSFYHIKTLAQRFLFLPTILKPFLDLPISTANRSSDTNRVGPLSLAQWNGRDFVFSPLGFRNSQFSEPVAARLVSDAPLI